MSVIRVHKTSNYTVMSNRHFKEREMSLKAKGLLSLMLSLPDDWNYSISGLVTLSRDGKDSVMSALSELEKFGYLKRERIVNEKGQFNGVEYNIFEEPQPKNPVSEKQNSEKQESDNSNSEKPRQLNTNSINHLNNKDIKELNKNKRGFREILSSIQDMELRELYIDYIEARENMEAPLSAKGLEMLIERCERLSAYNVKVQKLLLEAAIINNWKNVYVPSESELKAANNETVNLFKSMMDLQ